MALAIDTARTQMVVADQNVQPVSAYAELSDGSRRRIDGRQATHPDTGMPLWFVIVMLLGEPGQAPTLVKVKTESVDAPVLPGLFQPVTFEGLTCVPYVDQGGRVALSWRASGVKVYQQAKAA